MDWKLLLEVAGFLIALVGMLVLFLRKMDAQFSENRAAQAKDFTQLRRESRESFHDLDKKMYGIESTVGPYARDIEKLTVGQSDVVLRITEIGSASESLRRDLDTLGRRVEAIQNKGSR